MEESSIDRVRLYLEKYCELGVHPHQLAKALDMDEATITAALAELAKQGRIRLRSANIEWLQRRKTQRQHNY